MAEVTRLGVCKLAAPALLLLAFFAPTGAPAGKADELPDPWEIVAVPEGNKVAFSAYAEGVQIYRWNGTSWSFVAPEATLYDWDGEVVGIHYAGPTWESESGSNVVGSVDKRYTPNPDAIPWLRLKAVESEGPGIFHRVTYIQRVKTVGGLAPAFPGEFEGEVVRVPYAADYVFYRAKN